MLCIRNSYKISGNVQWNNNHNWSRPQLEAKIAVTSGWSGIFNVQSNCCISLPLIQSSFHHYTVVCTIAQILKFCPKIIWMFLITIFLLHPFSQILKDWAGKKVTILKSKFLMVKSSELFKSFYLHFTWLCGSWNHQRFFEK